MTLTDKIVLIVGGATGIGKATAEVCAAQGATVLVADFNEAAGKETAAAVKGSFYKVNVADEASVSAMFAQIAAQHDKLDALIQTAGVLKGAYVPIEEFSTEMFHQVLDVNLVGSFLCAKHATPLLKKAGKGVIVLLSSIAATAGSSSYAYGSSKGGVSSLGITLAKKLADDNIRVNVVAPGNIDTGMKRSVIEAETQVKGAPVEQGQYILGEPIGVAKVLAWLISDDADYVRGSIDTR